MIKQNLRYMVMALLYRMEKDDAYSNIVLDALIKNKNLNKRDCGYITRLFYGVLERKITLDYIISSYIKKGKTQDKVLIILRMAFYEMLYLNTGDYAIVNEYVNLVKSIGAKSASGFINAVLRTFIRDGKKVKYPIKTENEVDYLKILYSCSDWIVDELIRDYGFEAAERFLDCQLDKPLVTIRVNTTKITAEKLIDVLESEGAKTALCNVPGCLIVKSGDVIGTKAFMDGLFHVQDISSQLCALVASSLKPNMVLDVCSAPGGKAFTIAEETKADVLACDLYEKRVGLIEKGLDRLGLFNIKTLVHDAINPFEKEFDLVLCDVPCSGLGVIRRKPEIKYKNKIDVDKLMDIQYSIICNSSKSVKAGGYLVYSTCTLRKCENENIIDLFLKTKDEFELCCLPDFIRNYFECSSDMLTMIPSKINCDGFFIAVLRRKV